MFHGHFELFQKIDRNTELKDYVNGKMFDFIHRHVRA